jgi:hypothetical protein
MKRAGNGGKRIRSLSVRALLIALCAAPSAFPDVASAPKGADSAIVASVIPSVAPGAYRASQSISFLIPPSSRLLVGVDGAKPSESSGPLILAVPDGSERTFSVETVLFPYDPAGEATVRSRFAWTIDRKPPAVPTYAERRTDTGRWATLISDEGDTVHWKMFHPVFGSNASGEGMTRERVYVPDGATLCAWATDRAGNRGLALSIEASSPRDGAFPCRIVSPVRGTWANTQPLVIDRAPGVEVSYTTDGSDPSLNGIPYREPLILSDPAIRTVRVFATDGLGNAFSDSVDYAVDPRAALSSGASPVRDLGVDGSLVRVGDFLEVLASPGVLCSPGDSVIAESASNRLVISSVRGVRTYQPMTATDGVLRWRWVFEVGADGARETDAVAQGNVPAVAPGTSSAPVGESPKVSVLEWYFVDIAWREPVYASLDGHAWFPCDGPVLVDRSVPHTMNWYSGSWKNGEVQLLSLPAKPQLSGLPAQGLTADPVFITCDGTPYVFHYEGGYFNPSIPSSSSPSLGSGLLAEIPNGAETRFSFAFRASLDGIDHGTLTASFVMDRKSPRSPSAGIPDSLVYSRDPVVITPSGEDMIQVSVVGEPFSQEGGKLSLLGDHTKPIDYTVRLFAVDRAGNRSPVRERTVTVDLNALYVNPSATVTGARDGTPASPFATLDDAITAMRGPSAWRIEIAGDCELRSPRSIRNDVSIRGNGHALKVSSIASLSVSRSSLSISDCSVDFTGSQAAANAHDVTVKSDSALAPLAFSRTSPLQLDGASLSLERCSISASLTGSGSLLSAKDSRVVMSAATVSLSAGEYAILVDAARSSVRLDSCSFTVTAKDAVCASLSGSQAWITDSVLTVTALSAGRAVEAWSSTVDLARVTLARAATSVERSTRNADTAIWLDGSSRVTGESGLVVKGFGNARGTERAKE